MAQRPDDQCQHCYEGRLYRRGLYPAAKFGGEILYGFVDIDKGECPKCNGTNRSNGEFTAVPKEG